MQRTRSFSPRGIRTTLMLVALVAGQIGSLQAPLAAAEAGRVLPEGAKPNDRRLRPPKDLNGYFPFRPPATKEAWESRSRQLKRRVLVSTGLWPMPKKTALNPVIHGKVERKGFTVEKVYLESVPKHYVTGLLYRPVGKSGKLPAVLCPHGHGGRLQDYGEGRMDALIKSGGEKHKASGRYPKLARCAQLARMGCVVFIFDMLGYADSVQIPASVAHRFSKQRPELDTPDRWGFFSTQAELRLQSIMGLQTWNSIRALDFLAGLEDVDPKRIGVTGGSGGGTQTILLGAIDDRPIVAFPNGMVSTSMQGGCTCENCCLLRIGNGNVELAALFAPRPQGMTAANDWTKDMMTKGYPELQQLYEMLGAKDNVMCEPQLHFPHNYNYVTRALMYSWFNKHMKLGLQEPIIEEDFKPLTAEEWTVWNDEHPRPKVDANYEPKLLKWIADQSDEQLRELTPKDRQGLRRFRRVTRGALSIMIGRGVPAKGRIEREKVHKDDRGDHLEMRDLLRFTNRREEVPIVSLFPKAKFDGQVVLWIDGQGKSALFGDNGKPIAPVQKLLDGGAAVIGADLFATGEFQADGRPARENRTVANKREFAGFTYTYNHPLFAQRVHDILTLVSFVRNVDEEHKPKRVDLVGVGGAGPLAAAARALAGQGVNRTALDTGGFRFAQLKSYKDANMLPGAVKYGDLPAMLALHTGQLWVSGEEGAAPKLLQAVYSAAGAEKQLHWGVKADDARAAAAEWLLK